MCYLIVFSLLQPDEFSNGQRGIYFEIKYSDLLMDAQTRRQVISNAKVRNLYASGYNYHIVYL